MDESGHATSRQKSGECETAAYMQVVARACCNGVKAGERAALEQARTADFHEQRACHPTRLGLLDKLVVSPQAGRSGCDASVGLAESSCRSFGTGPTVAFRFSFEMIQIAVLRKSTSLRRAA